MIERIGDDLILSHIGQRNAMAKYKSHHYSQRMMLPVSLKGQLVPETLEFAIQTLVEERMDMAFFEDRYQNDETRRVAYDPKILLKVVLLGYARGLVSSRKMEQDYRKNVKFMALAFGGRPDHSTIVTFVFSMWIEVVPFFRDGLLFCEENGLLGGDIFCIGRMQAAVECCQGMERKDLRFGPEERDDGTEGRAVVEGTGGSGSEGG